MDAAMALAYPLAIFQSVAQLAYSFLCAFCALDAHHSFVVVVLEVFDLVFLKLSLPEFALAPVTGVCAGVARHKAEVAAIPAHQLCHSLNAVSAFLV